AVSSLNLEARVTQDLFTCFDVGPLKTNNKRNGETQFLGCRYNALGNHVALHDPAKDINENALYLVGGENHLKGFGHHLFGCATTHIKEVSWLPSIVFDDIHGAHGKSGAIDQAANIAIQ